MIERPLPQDYDRVYSKALRTFPHVPYAPEPDGAFEVFRAAMKLIEGDLEPNVPAFGAYIPSFFPGSTISTACNALFAGIRPEEPTLSGYAWRVSPYAYGFLECNNLGRKPEECNDDGPVNMFILLKHEKGNLYAWVMAMDWENGGWHAVHRELRRECGKDTRQNTGALPYNKLLKDVIDAFVANGLLHEKCSVFGLKDCRPEEVPAIVVSGEASEAGVKEIDKAASEAVVSDTPSVGGSRQQIPPLVIAAEVAPRHSLRQRTPHLVRCRVLLEFCNR